MAPLLVGLGSQFRGNTERVEDSYCVKVTPEVCNRHLSVRICLFNNNRYRIMLINYRELTAQQGNNRVTKEID